MYQPSERLILDEEEDEDAALEIRDPDDEC